MKIKAMVNLPKLLTTYMPNKIHADPMSAPKLSINPAKNQILAPIEPKQPPSDVSPRT